MTVLNVILSPDKLLVAHENAHVGGVVAGGKLLCATLTASQAVMFDLGDL